MKFKMNRPIKHKPKATNINRNYQIW